MSPKKKPTPTKSAPKDDLINSLFDTDSGARGAHGNHAANHSDSQTDSDSESSARLSNTAKRATTSPQRPPPPPPPVDESDRIYNFDDDVTRGAPDVHSQKRDDVYDASRDDTNAMAHISREDAGHDSPTLSIVRNDVNPHSVPTFEEPSRILKEKLELEEIKTVVHVVGRDQARADQSQTNSKHGVSRLSQSREYQNVDEESRDLTPTKPFPNSGVVVSPKAPEKGGDKLQKLEDVLRRLKPQFPGKPKGPLYDSDTAAAAVQKAKAENAKSLDEMAPPPIKPVGIVAKAIYSGTNTDSLGPERAPTEPVKTSIDPHVDEKTVAAQQTPSPMLRSNDGLARPVWQDAKTELLSQMTTSDNPDADPEAEQFMPTEIRANSPGARFREEARQAQPGAAIFSSSEAALRQSENLRVAQKRISELENELERVRRENESLRSAGETLRRRTDELQAHAENAEMNTQEAKKIAEEERKVLKGQIQSRDREISEMKSRIDDAENRLESNFRKIRVRERDLEHRIEIIKAESQSIAASKDRMILELKRQIDQISSELNHSKAQVQETFGQFKDKQETARRAVRALRIALTVLEGEEDSGSRKAE
ncbi:hypothetical protein BH10BDE1_BH10BDE1_24570 [soil metagenome]